MSATLGHPALCDKVPAHRILSHVVHYGAMNDEGLDGAGTREEPGDADSLTEQSLMVDREVAESSAEPSHPDDDTHAGPFPPPLPPRPVRRIGAGGAIGAFVIYLAGQILVGIFVVIAFLIGDAIMNGEGFQKRIDATVASSEPALILLSIVGGGLAVFLLAFFVWRSQFGDSSTEGFAFRWGAGRTLGFAAIAGAILGTIWIFIVQWAPPDTEALGPLSKMVARGGWHRIGLAFAAVFLAPPVEEFLFRGVMFAGFARRWGVVTAGVLVTVLFVSLHLFENLHYLPGIMAVTTLAVIALLLRVRTQSLGAPVVLHTTYNGVLVLSMFLAS